MSSVIYKEFFSDSLGHNIQLTVCLLKCALLQVKWDLISSLVNFVYKLVDKLPTDLRRRIFEK